MPFTYTINRQYRYQDLQHDPRASRQRKEEGVRARARARARAKELLSQEVRNDWLKSPETLERERVLS